jgi:hypothetical protein
MPISFSVDQQHECVRTVYTGVITAGQLEQYIASLTALKLLRLPQLIDGRQAVVDLTRDQLEQFSKLLASLRNIHGQAPVAFVAGNEASYRASEQYAELGAGGNPAYRAFPDLRSAETWIEISR